MNLLKNSKVQLDKESIIDDVASETEGYVARDLAGVFEKAVQSSLRQHNIGHYDF